MATLALCSLVAFAAEAQEATIPTTRYVVREGDSCASIAQRFFGSRRRHDVIHSYNPELGPPPHDLVVGTVLVLPVRAPEASAVPDARLTAVRRDVLARRVDASEWQPASRGEALFRGWRVNTLERSSAQVTFQDTSVVEIRASTLVVIYGNGARTARAATGAAVLETGTLRSRLGSLRMRVDTPTSRSEIDGGSAVVSTDTTGSRVSSHEGRGVRVRSTGAPGTVTVRPGFGTVVHPGERPTPPRALPDAPVFTESEPGVFAAIGVFGGTASGSWSAVPGAGRYHVEVLREGGSEVVASVDVPADVHAYELRGLPPGSYRVTVATIDAEGLEGALEAHRDVRVVALPIELPGQTAPEEGSADPSAELEGPLRLPPGVRVSVPAGLRCEGQDEARLVAFDRIGPGVLTCSTEDGLALAPIPIEVLQPPLTLAVASTDADVALARGVPTTVTLTRGGYDAPLPEAARFEASEGVTITAVDWAVPSVTLVASPEAQADAFVRVVLPDAEGTPVELARVPLTIAPTVTQAPVVEPPYVEAPTQARTSGNPAAEVGPFGASPMRWPTTDVTTVVSASAGAFRDRPATFGGSAQFALRMQSHLTLDLAFDGLAPVERSPGSVGAMGATFGLRALLFRSWSERAERLSLSLGVHVFAPLHPDDAVLGGLLVRPTLQLGWFPGGNWSILGRLGVIADGSASAYRLFDASTLVERAFAERFALGLSLDGRFGRAFDARAASLGVGVYGSVDVGPTTFVANVQVEPFQDAQRLLPVVRAGIALRIATDVPDPSRR